MKEIMSIQDSFILEKHGLVIVGSVPEQWLAENEFPLVANDIVVIQSDTGLQEEASVRDIDIFTEPLVPREPTSERVRTMAVSLTGMTHCKTISVGSKLFLKARSKIMNKGSQSDFDY